MFLEKKKAIRLLFIVPINAFNLNATNTYRTSSTNIENQHNFLSTSVEKTSLINYSCYAIYNCKKNLSIKKITKFLFFCLPLLFKYQYDNYMDNIYDFDCTVEHTIIPAENIGNISIDIMQVADLHLNYPGNVELAKKCFKETKSYIDKNKIEVDFVVQTGDIIDNPEDIEEDALHLLKSMKEYFSSEVFAILGNHERLHYNGLFNLNISTNRLENLEKFYSKIGWNLLRNSHSIVELKNGKRIALIGLDCKLQCNNNIIVDYSNMIEAFNGIENTDIKIVATHTPKSGMEILENRADVFITLSGHTHGLKVTMETQFISSKIYNPICYNKYSMGLYVNEKQNSKNYLYVSQGVAMGKYFPKRVNVAPAINIITLYGM